MQNVISVPLMWQITVKTKKRKPLLVTAAVLDKLSYKNKQDKIIKTEIQVF